MCFLSIIGVIRKIITRLSLRPLGFFCRAEAKHEDFSFWVLDVSAGLWSIHKPRGESYGRAERGVHERHADRHSLEHRCLKRYAHLLRPISDWDDATGAGRAG